MSADRLKPFAILATACVGLLAIGLTVNATSRAPTKAAASAPARDDPGAMKQADGWWEQAATRARSARSLMTSNRAAARRELEQALTLLEKATAAYGELLDRYPDRPEYEFLGEKVDRMNLEKVAYRKLLGELR